VLVWEIFVMTIGIPGESRIDMFLKRRGAESFRPLLALVRIQTGKGGALPLRVQGRVFQVWWVVQSTICPLAFWPDWAVV